MSTIKAIETRWKGYRFRSRLEARYAVLFDALGIQWEYEKEGYSLPNGMLYLPDFWIPLPFRVDGNNSGYFVEIKGESPSTRELELATLLAINSKHHVHIFSGTPGEQETFYCMNNGEVRREPSVGEEIPKSEWRAFQGRMSLMCFAHVCNSNARNIDSAIAAARSARFEHGETSR